MNMKRFKAHPFLIGIAALWLLIPVGVYAGILKWVELPQSRQDPYIYSVDYNSLHEEKDGWAYYLLKETPRTGFNSKVENSKTRDKNAAFYIEYASINVLGKKVKPIEIRAYSGTNQILKYYKYPENTVKDVDSKPLYQMISDFVNLYFMVIQHPKAKENANQYAYALQGHVYSGVLQQQLQCHWKPRFTDDEVAVHFLIDKTGKVVDPQITKSSNVEALDKLALKTIEQAGPFPSFPSNWPQETIKVELVFRKK
jgi:TonB family protein